MKKQKILVPLDGSKNSERGLNHALTLAEQTKMSILGLYVRPVHLLSAIWRAGDLKNEMLKKAKDNMKKARRQVEKKNIIFEESIEDGVPGPSIVTFAQNKKNKISLIVIGAKSKGVSKEKYFGSVSNYVLNKSKVPVLIV